MDFSEYISFNNDSNQNNSIKNKCLFIHKDLIKCLGNIKEQNKQQKDLPNDLSKCQELINNYYSCVQRNSIISSLQS